MFYPPHFSQSLGEVYNALWVGPPLVKVFAVWETQALGINSQWAPQCGLSDSQAALGFPVGLPHNSHSAELTGLLASKAASVL